MIYFLKIITGIFLTYCIYICFLYFAQRSILFPTHLIPSSSQNPNPNHQIESIWIEMPEGKKVEAWYLKTTIQNKRKGPALIFAHGNGELIDYWPKEMQPFVQMGISVLIVEYPGYGRSLGSPSQKTITKTFVNAYDWLVQQADVDPDQIVFYGRSLGGGVVCALARERPPAAMILASTFTSVKSMAKRYFVPQFLVRDPFDNLACLKNFNNPVLIMHGKYDEVIEYSHGVRLHQINKNSKLITYPCGHNDFPLNWEIYWQDIQNFLMQALPTPHLFHAGSNFNS